MVPTVYRSRRTIRGVWQEAIEHTRVPARAFAEKLYSRRLFALLSEFHPLTGPQGSQRRLGHLH